MGNGSNEVGKYTTVVVDLYSMGYVVVIDDIANLFLEWGPQNPCDPFSGDQFLGKDCRSNTHA